MRRHHPQDQIIGDKRERMMTQSKIRNKTCLVCEFEPKTIRNTLEIDEWIKAMNE